MKSLIIFVIGFVLGASGYRKYIEQQEQGYSYTEPAKAYFANYYPEGF